MTAAALADLSWFQQVLLRRRVGRVAGETVLCPGMGKPRLDRFMTGEAEHLGLFDKQVGTPAVVRSMARAAPPFAVKGMCRPCFLNVAEFFVADDAKRILAASVQKVGFGLSVFVMAPFTAPLLERFVRGGRTPTFVDGWMTSDASGIPDPP